MVLLPSFKKKTTVFGQTYIDILISVAILLILTAALFTLVASAFELVSFTQARITARHLASEKIELIRNLPYADVGTLGGIPAGLLPQTENVLRNNLNYTVKTSIVYIDDSFDQLAPDDSLPTDYKRVRVDVSWGGIAASSKNPITLITDIAPRGVETTAGGGTLSILVFDAYGQPVGQADVRIVASEVNPPVDLTLQTANDGRIILPGTPICISCYQIFANKDSYSSDRTYSTEEIANPDKPHQTILESQLTEISFAIDKLSTLVVRSTENRENNFSALPGQAFYLTGEKTLGTDVMDEPVYKFNETFTTNDSGQVNITDLEWDNYHLFLPDGSTWDIAGVNPWLPITVLPDKEQEIAFALGPHTDHSLLAIFKDSFQTPVASVSAVLSDGFGFEASRSSGLTEDPDFGQVFFADLANQVYTLEATAAGFLDFSGSVSVSGTTQEEIVLEEE